MDPKYLHTKWVNFCTLSGRMCTFFQRLFCWMLLKLLCCPSSLVTDLLLAARHLCRLVLPYSWGEGSKEGDIWGTVVCCVLALEASEQPLVAGSSVLAFQRWPRSTNSLCVPAFYTLLSVSMCVFLLQAPFLPFLVFLHEIKHHLTFSDWLNPSSCPSCRGFANIAVLLLMQSLSKAFWSYLAILYTQWLKDDESFQVAGDVIISPVSQLEDGGVTSAA